MISHSRPWLTREDELAVSTALRTGMIANGARAQQFEREFCHWISARGGCIVGSGTAALTMALQALDLKPGSEVVIPTYVCVGVLRAVRAAALEPILCDVEDDWCMSRRTVCEVLSRHTKAVVLVHPFGIAAPLADVCSIGLPVIEDSAQRLADRREYETASNKGIAQVFSFQATKCLTTCEGGFAATDDLDLLNRLQDLRDDAAHGGFSPISDLQASIGLSQLTRYPQSLEIRRRLAKRYFDRLDESICRLPRAVAARSMYFRFPVRGLGDFETLRVHYASCGINVRRGVDSLLHQNFVDLPRRSEFRTAERLFAETLSAPIYPAMTDAEQDAIIESTNRLLEARCRCA